MRPCRQSWCAVRAASRYALANTWNGGRWRSPALHHANSLPSTGVAQSKKIAVWKGIAAELYIRKFDLHIAVCPTGEFPTSGPDDPIHQCIFSLFRFRDVVVT